MKTPPDPAFIVRCCLRDIGSPLPAANYCKRIATAARLNPWGAAGDAEAYAEAARRLYAMHDERDRDEIER